MKRSRDRTLRTSNIFLLHHPPALLTTSNSVREHPHIVARLGSLA